MGIKDHIENVSQEAVGKTALAIGSAGFTVQVLTEWASLAAITVNLILGIGGLYLMYQKIFDKRRNRRDLDA
jgi:hypothetical protein